MKAVVAAFNQEKALVGAFSVITNLRMELFEALLFIALAWGHRRSGNGGIRGYAMMGACTCTHTRGGILISLIAADYWLYSSLTAH